MVFLTCLWTRKHFEKGTIKKMIYYLFLLISHLTDPNPKFLHLQIQIFSQ